MKNADVKTAKMACHLVVYDLGRYAEMNAQSGAILPQISRRKPSRL